MVLMMAMSTPSDVPQGLLFNRGGCNGAHTTFLAAAPVRGFIRNVIDNRPHLIGRTFHAVGTALAPRNGCSASFSTRAVATAGCAGTVLTSAAAPMASVPPKVGGPILDRLIVRRVMVQAVRQGMSKLSPEQQTSAWTILGDSFASEVAARKFHAILESNLQKKAASGAVVGALGDGHIFQMIVDNLPALINAFASVWKIIHGNAMVFPHPDCWRDPAIPDGYRRMPAPGAHLLAC
jgi:hypothetical protein